MFTQPPKKEHSKLRKSRLDVDRIGTSWEIHGSSDHSDHVWLDWKGHGLKPIWREPLNTKKSTHIVVCCLASEATKLWEHPWKMWIFGCKSVGLVFFSENLSPKNDTGKLRHGWLEKTRAFSTGNLHSIEIGLCFQALLCSASYVTWLKVGMEIKVWLVVSTHLKNISQNGNLPQFSGWK